MKTILIVKFGALGDVIRTSYILKGLYEKYQEPDIYWLTSSQATDLLRYNPYIVRVATPDMNFHDVARISFDLVISLDDETEVLSKVETFRYERLIGAYVKNGRPDYTDESAEWFDMGLISRYGKESADARKKVNEREHNEIMASMLDITIDRPEFFNSPVLEQRVMKKFPGDTFNIGLNSGAGSRWEAKQLDMGETIRLAKELLRQEIGGKRTRVFLLGGEEETERHTVIKHAVSSSRMIDTGNRNSLLEFAAMVKSCDYVISSDSLALHLAIAQKVKNLSFYAPTSAAEIGTFGTGIKITSLSDDYCSYRRDADNRTITADRIVKAFLSHIQG